MATDLATAYIQLVPSAKGIKSNIEKELGDTGASAGQSAGAKIGSAIKKAIAAAGIGAVIKSAFSEGMELQQNLGGTEAVFGEFADSIQSKATEAYKNMGMSASEYMATANKMGALFQGSGLDQQRTLDLTTQAMQRAADVASVMGLDTTAAMESIAGAAKGNFTMMDNLGVAMNATTIEAYALEQGINFEWKTASNAEKAELAMQMFFERTEQYAGNFARESAETLSGSLGAVKSAFKDVLGNLALGADMAPSLEALKNTVITFVSGNLMPTLVNIISTGLPVLVEMVISLGPPLIDAGIQAIQSLCTGLSSALPQLIPQTTMAIVQIVQGLLSNLPMILDAGLQLIVGLGQGLLSALPLLVAELPQITTSIVDFFVQAGPLICEAGIQLLTSLTDQLPQIVESVCTAIPQIVSGLVSSIVRSAPSIAQAGVNLLVSLISNLPSILVTVLTSIPQIVGSLVSAIISSGPQLAQAGFELFVALIRNLPSVLVQILQACPRIISGIVSALGQGVSQMVQVGGNLVKGLWQGIQGLATWLWNKVKSWASSIWDGICSVFRIGSPSKLTEWAGEMLDRGLGGGIADNADIAVNATKKMAEKVADVPFGLDTSGIRGTIIGAARQTATVMPSTMAGPVTDDTSTGGTATVLAQILQALLALSDKLDRLQIVLDTRALVGGILDPMNEAMGAKSALEERGVA